LASMPIRLVRYGSMQDCSERVAQNPTTERFGL